MRFAQTPGQSPDQVVSACVAQARRAMSKPETRIVTLEALRPFTRGTGHSDLNGDGIPQALYDWAESVTFYREPAGPRFAGEVVQSPALTAALNGGDCDDVATAVAAMGACLGLETAIGRVVNHDGTFAHIVCAVRSGWFKRGEWKVIDPQQREITRPEDFPGARWTVV